MPARDSLVLFSSSWKDRLAAGVVPGVPIVDARVPVRCSTSSGTGSMAADRIVGRAGGRGALDAPAADAGARGGPGRHHPRPLLPRPSRRHRAEIRRDYPVLAADHARRADGIVAVSNYTASLISNRLAVDRDRIAICPPGAPPWAPAERPPAGGPILFLGTLEPRKNVATLLDAYAELVSRRPDAPPLVLAGRVTPAARTCWRRSRQPPLAGRVRAVGYVSGADRERLYRDASVLVMPSLDEGFGMPALEAMTIGLPVVVSDRGALPEVVGDAGLLVDPEDPEAMAAAIERLLDSRELAVAPERRRQSARDAVHLGRKRGHARRGVSGCDRKATRATMSRPLRIGIDARELLGSATGVGRYLGELLRRWTVRADAVRPALRPLRPRTAADRPPARVDRGARGWRRPRHLVGADASARRAPSGHARCVLRAGLHGAPAADGAARRHHSRRVVRRAPRVVPPARRLRRRLLTRRTAHRAAIVFTDSEFSRGEIGQRLNVDRAQDSRRAARRRAAGVGRLADQPARTRGAVRRVDLQPAASPGPDRRLRLGHARMPDARLVIVGDDRTLAAGRSARDRDCSSDRVEGRLSGSTCPNARSPSCTPRASVFAFLSEYEGFGLTPLEAMSAGLPPSCSTRRSRAKCTATPRSFVAKGDVEARGARAAPAPARAVDARRRSSNAAAGYSRAIPGTRRRTARSPGSRRPPAR